MKNYVSQKLAWIRYLIEAVDRVGRREIEMRWESVKGLGDEEGFNRMVEYLSMRLFGDGYWWEFEAEAEKEGKQRVGEVQECVEHTLRKDQKITKNTKNICLKDKKEKKQINNAGFW